MKRKSSHKPIHTPSKRRLTSKKTSKSVAPKTADEFFAMPDSMQELYLTVLEAVARVRQGMSRTRATRELNLTRAQLDRFARSAFKKGKNGRYVAKPYDRLLRVVTIISKDGMREVATRDSRQASKAGRHSAAINRYLQSGDASGLAQFQDAYIVDAKGEKVPLLTDLEEVEELGSAGVLSFESLYARSS